MGEIEINVFEGHEVYIFTFNSMPLLSIGLVVIMIRVQRLR